MEKTPFPPFEKRLLEPKIGAGMDSGKTTRTGNTVWHRMVGTLTGTDAYFRLAWVKASTNWGIGGSLDGSLDGVIYLWVAMPGTLIPWASGPWNEPGYDQGDDYVREFGAYGINAKADSIEFSGQPNTPMTMLQWQKGIWLTAAVIHAGGRDSEQTLWNMHHREFTTPQYKDCPFGEVYKYTQQYQRGIVLTLQHYEGKSVEDHIQIGNLLVPLPFGQKQPPRPKPSAKPIFVAFEKPHKAILWKGAAYRQWGNTQATIYSTAQDKQQEEFVGFYNGQELHGSNRWFVTNNPLHERVHESGISSWIDLLPKGAGRTK